MRILLLALLLTLPSPSINDYTFLNNLLDHCEAKAWSQAAGYDCIIVEKVGNEIKVTVSKDSNIERFTIGPNDNSIHDLKTKLRQLPKKADAEKLGPPLPTKVDINE